MNSGTLFFALLATLLVTSKHSSLAETTTEPVGSVAIELAGNTDSYVYMPFIRSAEYSGPCSGLSLNSSYDWGETFTDSNSNGTWDTGEPFVDSKNVLEISPSPGFTTNQFVYAPGSQSKHYYVLLKSSNREGMYYSVVANTANSITIDLAGDDLQGIVVAGTAFQVIPYDTLSTVFPNGTGVHPCSSHSFATRQSEVLLPDTSTAGTNLASIKSYYYYSGISGAGPGWRQTGMASTIANDDPLPPDCFFIVRHNISTATRFRFNGSVQMSTLSTPLSIISANIEQDNAVALPLATETTLSQLQLVESGAFSASPSHSIIDRKDQLLVWDNTIPGQTKAANVSYYYYSGTSGAGPGWRKTGVSQIIADSDVVLSSTKCFIVRKKAGSTPSTVLWRARPKYVPDP